MADKEYTSSSALVLVLVLVLALVLIQALARRQRGCELCRIYGQG